MLEASADSSCREIIELEGGVVDSESIHSGKVPIHPRPATSSAWDLHLKLGSVSNEERGGSSGSVVRASD